MCTNSHLKWKPVKRVVVKSVREMFILKQNFRKTCFVVIRERKSNISRLLWKKSVIKWNGHLHSCTIQNSISNGENICEKWERTKNNHILLRVFGESLIKLPWNFPGIKPKQPRKVYKDISNIENLGQLSSSFYLPSGVCNEYSLRGNVGISAPYAIK